MRKKLLSLLLCTALLSGSLTGCQWGQGKPEAEPPAPAPVAAEPESAAPAPQSEAEEDAVDKEETVYVQAKADGDPKKVTVEVRLRNPGDGKAIQDRSNLTNIRSTKGDEEFTQTGSTLLWDNHGEDLAYKGESAQPLPVRVRMSAVLDGKALPPEELAGRSGHLKLRFDYDNLTEETVTVQQKKKKAKKGQKEKDKEPRTEEYTVKVPFLAMTALFLREDVFSNVKVTNGECMKADDQTIVLGYACPGLAESLRLADFEATEELDVPEYVEVEADVTDFELDFTATVLTPELAGKLETDSLDDLDELAQGLDELSDAVGKLSNATGKLSDGLKKFQKYLRRYTKGVHAVRKGSEQLRKGLKLLNRRTSQMQKQMEELGKQLPQPDEGASLNAAEQTPAELFQQAKTALDQLSGFAQGVEDWCQEVEGAKGSALASLEGIDWTGVEAGAAETAKKQVQEACTAAAEDLNLTDEQKAALTQWLTGCIDLTGATASAQEASADAAAALEGISDASALLQGAQSLKDTVEELQGVLGQMEPYAQSLPTLKELSASVLAYAEGVRQLSDGAGALTSALKQLDRAGSKLTKGFSGAVKGAKKLAKAVKKFDEEGVEELNGEDVEELALRLRAVRQAGKAYQSFSGLPDGRRGNVRFVIETEEIREKE